MYGKQEIKIKRIYFLHGFMGTAETHFVHQVESLKDNYELILIDLPGHGNATVEASENYFEETLCYVISQMKEFGKGYIVGLSLGASVAIHIALNKPNLVSGVVLTGYSPFVPDELKDVMEKQYDYFINIEKNDRHIAEHFKKLHGEKWNNTLRKVLHTMTFYYPTVSEKQIKDIKVPVLILNGSNDVHEVESATYVKKVKGEIKIGLVPDAGHTANIDQPLIYNLILENFIKEN